MVELPVFPLRVTFFDGETLELDDPSDAETTLEWFDSEDDTDHDLVEVIDSAGRHVSLRIEKLVMTRCRLKEIQ